MKKKINFQSSKKEQQEEIKFENNLNLNIKLLEIFSWLIRLIADP